MIFATLAILATPIAFAADDNQSSLNSPRTIAQSVQRSDLSEESQSSSADKIEKTVDIKTFGLNDSPAEDTEKVTKDVESTPEQPKEEAKSLEENAASDTKKTDTKVKKKSKGFGGCFTGCFGKKASK